MADSIDSGERLWTEYWQSGERHSCFHQGRPLQTDAWWRPFFDRLENGAAIIDLACGAGALTALAVSHPQGFSVTAADYATDLPDIPGARLDRGVRLEALPYPAGTFDAAVSQFGIEYSAVERSLSEIARIVRPGGQFAFLMHALEGDAVKTAAARKQRLEALLAPGGVVAAVEAYGAALRQAREAPPDAAPVVERFREAAPYATDETASWALHFLGEVMQNALRFEPAYVIDNAAKVRRELAGQLGRLGLMISAARDARGMAGFIDAAAQAGLDAGEPRRAMQPGGTQTGWWISGVRK